MKVGIYVRVSTEEQAKEGYSISGQMQKLKAFCISQSWKVAGVYADEGVSAKDMERPELKRMLKDIENKEVNCVLVYKLDRLTRSVFDLYKMLETFDQYDCKFKSATEVYDTTTAMGRMFITIVAALAQWERENMGERMAFGKKEKARQGKWTSSHVPFGFYLNRETDILYTNEEEAIIVRKVFNMYKKVGMNQIARYLNNNKLYTRAGNKWSDNTIMKMLRNPAYCGYVYWGGETHEGLHEPIISEKEFEEAKKISEKRNKAPGRSVSSPYIFSTKLKCPNCNHSLVGTFSSGRSTKRGIVRYRNYRCRQRGRGNCIGCRNVSEIRLEKAFVNYLEKININDDLIKDTIDNESEITEDNTEEITSLKKSLKKIEDRKKKWQYAWTEDAISFDDFKKRMDEENGREKMIQREIEKLSENNEVEESDEMDKEELINILKDIRKNWNVLDNGEKKEIVNEIVTEIHYRHKNNDILIDSIDFA